MMQNYDRIFLPTLQRLSQLVNRQYGCRFDYLSDLELRRNDLREVSEKLNQGRPVMTSQALFLPIMPNGVLTGAAQVGGSSRLREQDISSLHQVVRMVLESTLQNVERLDTIELLENQLRMISDTDQDNLQTNLVRLDDHRPQPLADVTATPGTPGSRSRLRECMNFPFLVEAQSEEDAFRMAFEIHDTSGRKSFLPLEDLDESAFASPEALMSIGSCTLYATDFEHLTLERQQFFVEYFRALRGRGTPQLIVGTCQSYAKLKTDPAVGPEFLSRLTVGYLYLSQPFSHYKASDILEFFFDSLTGQSRLNV